MISASTRITMSTFTSINISHLLAIFGILILQKSRWFNRTWLVLCTKLQVFAGL